MRHVYQKWLCAMLAICMLLALPACKDEEPDVPASTDPVEPPVEESPAAVTSFTLNDSYILIRPDERTDEEVDAVVLLNRGLTSAYGGRFALQTDYVGKDDDENADTYEILVGPTNRAESQAIAAELGYNDWGYRVISDRVIVICGGSPAATVAATEAFLADVIGYTEDAQSGEALTPGSAVVLEVGTEKIYHYEYAIKSFMLGSHAIADYTIVTSHSTSEGVASIVKYFREWVGIELPVVSTRAYTGGPAIFFGCAGADGTHLDYGADYRADRYFITVSDGNVVVDFKNAAVATAAAARFLAAYTPKEVAETIHIPLTEGELLTGISIPKGTNSLALDSVEQKEVAPGVTYEEHLYFDPDGLPVRAYIMTVAPGAATISTCLPHDEMRIGTYANIQKQVVAAYENGKNVVAGVNADFFGDTMLGLCVKDGVLLHEAAKNDPRPWFGITLEGTPVIGTAEQYDRYRDKLLTAVGGSNIVLLDDYANHISVDHEFGYTRHPRTAVGIKPDDSVVLMVVDGRQSKVSNGAALADLADLLASLGCTQGLNLDGGGSCTFVLRDESGSFNVENSPSDGALRSVANGLMVVLP